MIYFSFSLYGSNPKYTRGMIENVKLIERHFPEARVAIYLADNVPSDITTMLRESPNVLIVPCTTKPGTEGSFDRFLAIDLSDCDILFIRDADSRVHSRDIACIEDFIAAPHKLFHIIRDHKYHTSSILAGMFGMRKGALLEPMSDTIARWKSMYNHTSYSSDQAFLHVVFYERMRPFVMIHDRCSNKEPAEMRTPFRVPITGDLFVGQVHDYKEDGSEFTVYTA